MATREQIGYDAANVNAAYGNFLKWRGVPDVPPIAQTSGVSYQPAQHTLYKEFSDAFASLPNLLKGARNTYETYWEQAKKSADDYRKGKSLNEINAELDANEVPLQYRPLLMSALEFRQGQESMQIAAQELTTKINSGEFTDLSPMDLDQAVTDFMNDQLAGLQEAHGTTGGTDAFYNGYYSEVAKVREFAQQRNDQLVEQRRQQDIQIQVQAASNELGQTAVSSADVEAGITALRETFNLDPISEVRAIEDVIKAASSNPNGVELINDLRSMGYRDGTLEDFFTKAYFDSAQIDVYNTLRQADAQRWSQDIERWDSLARGGAVGRLRSELNNALQASGNLETKEVQMIRQALLQSQHVAESMAKAKAREAQEMDALVGVANGEIRLNLAKFYGSKDDAIDRATNFYMPMIERALNASSDDEAKELTRSIIQSATYMARTNPDVWRGVADNLFPQLTRIEGMSDGDLKYFLDYPEQRYIAEGIDPIKNPLEFGRRVQMANNEFTMLQSITQTPEVFQAMMNDTKNYGGTQNVMIAGVDANNSNDIYRNLAYGRANSTSAALNAFDKTMQEIFPNDPLKQEYGIQYAVQRFQTKDLDNPIIRQKVKDYVNKKVQIETLDPIYKNMPDKSNYQFKGIGNETISSAVDYLADINEAMPVESRIEAGWINNKTAGKNFLNTATNVGIVTMLRELYPDEPMLQDYRFGLETKDINTVLGNNGLNAKIWQDNISNKVFVAITRIEGGDIVKRMEVPVDELGRRALNDVDYFNRLMSVSIGVPLSEMRRRYNMRVSQPTSMDDLNKQVLEPLGIIGRRFAAEYSMENIGYRYRQ